MATIVEGSRHILPADDSTRRRFLVGATAADLVIVPTASYDKEPLGKNPLLHELSAVRDGRVLPVDSDLWSSRSIVGARLVVDDLDRILSELPSQ